MSEVDDNSEENKHIGDTSDVRRSIKCRICVNTSFVPQIRGKLDKKCVLDFMRPMSPLF